VWKVVQFDRGVLQWTSPTGRVYTTEPETQLPAPDTHEYEATSDAADLDDTTDDNCAPF
jgi:hypothetical protein